MQWPYGIGLDIGVASVGWAVVALNDQAQPCGLIRLGSRIFPRAEQPKTGESLAAPRRMARSMRRRIRRKALRKQDLYQLMEQSGLASREELSALVCRRPSGRYLCPAHPCAGRTCHRPGLCPHFAAPDAAPRVQEQPPGRQQQRGRHLIAGGHPEPAAHGRAWVSHGGRDAL